MSFRFPNKFLAGSAWCLIVAVASFVAEAAPAPAPTAKSRFENLVAAHWEWQSKEFPEASTLRGDYRFNDRLTDHSEAASRQRGVYRKQLLSQIKAIDAKTLSGQDRITYDVLASQVERSVQVSELFARLPGNLPFGGDDDWLKLTPSNGPHRLIPLLVRASPFNRVRDYENYLKRLSAIPASLAAQQKWMERGIASGWIAPAISMRSVPSQLEIHIGTDAEKLPAFVPFTHFPADFSSADRERLAAAARKVIGEQIVPAFRELQAFVKDKYLPAAAAKDTALGASSLPGGMAYYDAMIGRFTTTSMTAKEVHELGLREVARIITEMDKVIARAGFTGTRAEFNTMLRTDPKFYYTDREEMLAGYRAIAKRADAELPRFFAELPRQPYGIRAMDASLGDAAEHYTAGAADGSRAGFFEANLNNLRTRPKHWMEVLVMHEAVPGHHLQIARAQELKDLPPFRKFTGFNAYSEGWGLYSEALGEELGFYKDPYSKYGQLCAEMHRAARLVVDTGIHAFGWDRDRVIKYLMDNAGLVEGFAIAETDRYILWAGQALGYKIGELKIKELRARAKAALGDNFELRRFHNAVLDNGPLPLTILEQQIDGWIAAEQVRSSPTRAKATQSPKGQ
ncbi:MAG: DUF885 domain-containing protein [Betaproteobacteria bacterium]